MKNCYEVFIESDKRIHLITHTNKDTMVFTCTCQIISNCIQFDNAPRLITNIYIQQAHSGDNVWKSN